MPGHKFVIIQIEDPEPLKDLEEIAKLKGIDIIFFGPGDFSHGIFDTRGLVFFVTVTAFFLFLSVKVLESRSVPAAAPKITLACAVPKRTNFEDIVDKLNTVRSGKSFKDLVRLIPTDYMILMDLLIRMEHCMLLPVR